MQPPLSNGRERATTPNSGRFDPSGTRYNQGGSTYSLIKSGPVYMYLEILPPADQPAVYQLKRSKLAVILARNKFRLRRSNLT